LDASLPTGLILDRQKRTLRLDWESGPPTILDWERLRIACPCAQCQGEFRTQLVDAAGIKAAAEETQLADVTIMGHYALQPHWASGHMTGIYTWEYLRGLGTSIDS
jgi:DUF971 family protein